MTSTKERVLRRKELLTLWKKKGVPSGKMPSLPSSLRKSAKWEDSSLGIEPIGSPNQFTTTHPEWGDDVAVIDRLQKELHARAAPVQRKKSATATNDDLRQGSNDLKMLLNKVHSQWHVARDALNQAKVDLAAKGQEVAELKGTLAERDAELSSLRRQLSGLKAFPKVQK